MEMIPVVTTPAGSCLTMSNWQESGVSVASFYLTSLLMKPGYDCLMTFPNLASYVGWQGDVVLNATMPARCKDGIYTLQSSYDGHRIALSTEDMFTLIRALQPQIVVLPNDGWQRELCQLLPETIFAYIPISALSEAINLERPYGIYVNYDEKKMSNTELFQLLAQHKERPYYVAGDLSLALMTELAKHGVRYVESNKPADDAYHGRVYASEGDFSIQDSSLAMQFEPIDDHCHCSTCNQQLTRAYLHHLFEHTPLLCQRFLVQHNAYCCQGINPPSPASGRGNEK